MSNGPIWFKSSYSQGDGSACVEVAFSWRKSSYSGSEGSNCVEVGILPQAVRIRDSKRKDGPQLAVGARSWAAFVGHVPVG
ncbi:DUF397 domain-containing protein [Streptomyces rectiverticillatus]|uniref:DUF397 domain-containing protein n=1 Tax=Streptomyces rectiverticillatus TaxID=173860 RepID=UPI0015C3CBF4|nr:DUF397 domain-containing protein [Streptomyces rectiverticillatus]QLE72423.1 DUF397 domain-containing protein [Streptomyces rectiverticillatus]